MKISHAVLEHRGRRRPAPEARVTTWVSTMPATVVSRSMPNVQLAILPAAPRPTPRKAKSGR